MAIEQMKDKQYAIIGLFHDFNNNVVEFSLVVKQPVPGRMKWYRQFTWYNDTKSYTKIQGMVAVSKWLQFLVLHTEVKGFTIIEVE